MFATAQPIYADADADDEWTIAAADPHREDLAVQVKLTPDGPWHRKAIGGQHTACGRELGGYATRDDVYDHQLCAEGCFTAFEIASAPPRRRRGNTDVF